MKLVLLGVSGAGKGTQAKNIVKRYNIEHISTGDILREHIKNKTPIGRKIQDTIDSGNLVRDDLVIEIVKDKMARPECKNGYILDGFPRTLTQAKELLAFADIDMAVYVMVDDQVVINRLTGRWICPHCTQMYHINNFPPKTEGICDNCGTKLIQREDDKAETVKDRLKVFHELTEPIIDYYKDLGLLFEVSGMGDINEITNAILNKLDSLE